LSTIKLSGGKYEGKEIKSTFNDMTDLKVNEDYVEEG